METERLCQSPPCQTVFGFRAAGVTSADIGNCDNNREAWDTGQDLSSSVTQGVMSRPDLTK